MNEDDVIKAVRAERMKTKIIKYTIIFSLAVLLIALLLVFRNAHHTPPTTFNATESSKEITLGSSVSLNVTAPQGDRVVAYAYVGAYNESIGSCNRTCTLTFVPKKALLYTIAIKDGNQTIYLPLKVNPKEPELTPPNI